jgi:peptidoglycan hydrolase-like protein with peptidoglycan-binding domain
MVNKVVISSGHGKYIRGASGYIDEVDEARLVVERVANALRSIGVDVTTYHDNTSTSQSENLNRIVNFHNSKTRDLDISCHFNAYQTTSKGMGSEVLYVTQHDLASTVVNRICAASGLINRGPKKRTDLAFLNGTDEPAILIETCFVDSQTDANIYHEKFDAICVAIAEGVSGEDIDEGEPPVPPTPIPPTPPTPSERATIAKGDTGPDVAEAQRILGINADGDFGPITDDAVTGYQAAAGVAADGEVGPITWEKLDDLDRAKSAGSDGLPPAQVSAIVKIAENSLIADYSWKDRGKAPSGYIAGVALSFALAATKLLEGAPAAIAAAQADRNQPDYDALSWYRSKFESMDMDNSQDGIDTLRHLFVMILGLGMRESSGRYCEGRDMSADNVSADTAEAGLFQTSWNIRSCSQYISPLLGRYWANPNGFLTQFKKGVTIKENELGNYGSGAGAQYQFLSKYAPAFHVFVTAIGMRFLRQHWGPINRSEVEIKADADHMLLDVQDILSEDAAETVAAQFNLRHTHK